MPVIAAIASNDWLFSRQKLNLGWLAFVKSLGHSGPICITRSGSGKGSGRSNTALTTLKIAVFAPIPSARVITAIAVKPGRFSKLRIP